MLEINFLVKNNFICMESNSTESFSNNFLTELIQINLQIILHKKLRRDYFWQYCHTRYLWNYVNENLIKYNTKNKMESYIR